ncbi:putative E3 ubiquitin-protein ligase rbrA [Sesamum alatum]|uniref:RBR-type E3 ubiquitin transferase n=1 Tax=Sesamum alatum TaxID=300844 RepID=A0AAE1YVA2_9LAMI|nr:putative E3 ubiquitin-protein ligase rbrA [Sesamum alatum]
MENQPVTALPRDDFPLSLLINHTHKLQHHDTLMTDAIYAEELIFQEALMASLLNIPLGLPESSSSSLGSPEPSSSVQLGEPSRFFCEICAETKDNDQVFTVETCNHRFCAECIAKHVAVKNGKSPIENGPSFPCPAGTDCGGTVEMEKCVEVVPKDVLVMWGDAICESMIGASQKFYCPYKDCSGLLVNDGEEVVRESECPFCRRLFCAQCGVPWHSGVGCEEFSRLSESERGREDLLVHELAKLKKWQRCPHCKFFVDKNEGCLHMTCRCGYEFCYACGATWRSTHHESCQ